MRSEMGRAEISTAPSASILAHPGKPIFNSGAVVPRFVPVRALFSWVRSNRAPIPTEREAEELLQCEKVDCAAAACRLTPAQFFTYQTRNSVQSNGATSQVRVHEYPDLTLALFHGPRCLARYSPNGELLKTKTKQTA
jgi:hypothetical protein